MATYKHIIWDWNGTIINDARLCLSVYNQMAIEYAIEQVEFDYYINNMNFLTANGKFKSKREFYYE